MKHGIVRVMAWFFIPRAVVCGGHRMGMLAPAVSMPSHADTVDKMSILVATILIPIYYPCVDSRDLFSVVHAL